MFRAHVLIKCRLSEANPTACSKHEPQTVSEESSYKPNYHKSTITDRNIEDYRYIVYRLHAGYLQPYN